MTKLSFSKREKIIFFISLGMMIVYGLFQGVFMPLRNRAELVEKRILVAEKRFDKNRRTIRKAKAFEKKYKVILDEFKQKASNERVMSSILSEIEEIASSISMRIADMKPKKVRQVDFYNNFSVSLAIDGELVDIMQFVHLLENPPHMFYIDDLRLNKSSPRKTTLRCQIVLSRVLIP